MEHIRYVFFDLDRTLWDFERCSRETLEELFAEYHPFIGLQHSFDVFWDTYRTHNAALWRSYERSEIEAAELRRLRWELSFGSMGVATDRWTEQMGAAYIDLCPRKPYLVPSAREILDYLSGSYEVHMITNGWKDTQANKLHHAGIGDYFGKVITSDTAGAKKPDPAIFEYALRETGARREASLYIGDNYEADVLGGLRAGWEVIFFNPLRYANPEQAREIAHLNELRGIL